MKLLLIKYKHRLSLSKESYKSIVWNIEILNSQWCFNKPDIFNTHEKWYYSGRMALLVLPTLKQLVYEIISTEYLIIFFNFTILLHQSYLQLAMFTNQAHCHINLAMYLSKVWTSQDAKSRPSSSYYSFICRCCQINVQKPWCFFSNKLQNTAAKSF